MLGQFYALICDEIGWKQEKYESKVWVRIKERRKWWEIKGENVGLISHAIRPNGLWALFSCPNRGRPTLHDWWAPVAQRYKEKVGAGARTMFWTPNKNLVSSQKYSKNKKKETYKICWYFKSSFLNQISYILWDTNVHITIKNTPPSWIHQFLELS